MSRAFSLGARALLFTTGAAVAYVVIGLLATRLLFVPPEVELTNYFRPGDQFGSAVEGFVQTVLAVDGDWLHTRLEIAPQAAGPPEHVHLDFDEKFTVREGVVSLLVNGEKRVLQAGESFTVPKMTPHKPFNETARVAVIQSDTDTKSIPIEFAYYLTQMYPVMDRREGTMPTLLQLSAFGNRMDTWIPGSPITAQRMLRTILAPTARLLGYRTHYDEHRPARR
jgi:mannose-6-phosphate isomerase-like protein (cupin superfamily)